ncbi:LpxI family protein [Rhizobium leguminosarum]|uniref:LpxI family protein n=1 Tax=Rhizobium TaxID=379 RepID=UPI0014785C0C|nr:MULTISPECIES: LpxI family protein [Rhizobium]MBY5355443.1 LpxI family protein [Rhizobium leguminosarum]MBY5400461.1 LpxI family protein [Rhizobium leguminosarum]NNH45726.1 LpxI family protein [Rhizobium laguerreae]UWM83394.1 LpxI family protein [Rhizobium leguminosarum bv. viciae]
MALSGDTAAGRLAIIAGGGLLPSYVAEAARAAGENPVIVALKDESDRRWEAYDHAVIGIGDFAALEGLLNRYGIGRVVMSGSVRRRPEWREVRPTLRTLMKMPAVIRTLLSGGDDKVLQMVIRLIEGNGRRVVGAHEIAPDLLAAVGPLGTAIPGEEDRRDINRAAEAAEMLGRLDVGQGAVAIGGRIVALEGLEGTDEMLERVAGLRAAGRISPRRRGALVKLCKPQQDIRADLPAIGVSTVLNAKQAGLAGVAVEAGRALVLDRAAVIKAADEAGLFVCGIDRGLPAWGLE